ncbi:LOW QUALITY PROTEIN: cytoplasmic phosphatidylinositol transfer protein 1-like [Pluvialis apricaria]
MLIKEYRICMPLTTEEYRVGQLYTISKHSHQESEKGEGVEVVKNEPHEDPIHGPGQFTEKRVHLSSKLPSWARAVTPRIFYITEKAWNYYPYTITGEPQAGRGDGHPRSLTLSGGGGCQESPAVAASRSHRSLSPPRCHPAMPPHDATCHGGPAEYTCSFLPKFSIYIETKYEDNCGDSENIFHSDKILGDHEVSFLDIAFDEIPERYYRSLEDPRFFSSAKTGRGPLREGWRQHTKPIMCSYKLVSVKFEVWGLQTRVEQFVHKVIRDILLIGHRQAFAWVDEWCGMTMEEVRRYEQETQEATNELIGLVAPAISVSEVGQPTATHSAPASAPSPPLSDEAPDFLAPPKTRPRKKSAPETLTLPALRERAGAE